MQWLSLKKEKIIKGTKIRNFRDSILRIVQHKILSQNNECFNKKFPKENICYFNYFRHGVLKKGPLFLSLMIPKIFD